MAIGATSSPRSNPILPQTNGDTVDSVKSALAGKHLLSIRRVNDASQVKELKRLLAAKGCYNGDVNNGKFDEKVLAAVARFQAENNLTKDGTVGQQTWAALMDLPGASEVPPGTDWLTAWNALPQPQRDAYVEAAPHEGIDLRAAITQRDSTGVPMFRQGDSRWGDEKMNNQNHSMLRAKGCAVASMAMAMSAISDKEINPGELDAYLDTHGGYDRESNLYWSVAAQAKKLKAERVPRAQLSDLDESLADKRPVVIGVDYKKAKRPESDHWITVTGTAIDLKGQKVYLANDPATGEVIRLYPGKDGTLYSYSGGMGDYRSTGVMVFLSR